MSRQDSLRSLRSPYGRPCEWLRFPFRTSAGRPCTKVYVARKTPGLLARIPATIAGHPVAVEQTGAFKALDR